LLNQGKASVVVDFHDSADRQALRALIATSDVVIEASRPRALLQLGVDADAIVRAQPGLVWVTITAHGARGEPANWVGFGDDCGVSGGLSAALQAVTGHAGFVGDAIADPLAGLFAACAAWEAWKTRTGGRIAVAMSHVVAECLLHAHREQPSILEQSLKGWSQAAGKPFPAVVRRPTRPARTLGQDTRFWLASGA
jgi:crotonobetainyl-CoA:carnitine CoA-transferase CaiB-like acyl-CoA transferase